MPVSVSQAEKTARTLKTAVTNSQPHAPEIWMPLNLILSTPVWFRIIIKVKGKIIITEAVRVHA